MERKENSHCLKMTNPLAVKAPQLAGKILEQDKSEEEVMLEMLVIGNCDDVVANLEKLYGKEGWGDVYSMEPNDVEDRATEVKDALTGKKRKPVWEDEDDIDIGKQNKKGMNNDCSEILRNRFEETYGTPSWAKHDKETHNASEDDESEAIVRCVGNFIAKSNSLVQGTIDFSVCKFLNSHLDKGGHLNTVEFHPTAQVAMIAQHHSDVFLRQVDAVLNPKIQTITFPGLQVSCAHFTEDGNCFLVISDRGNLIFTYDMMAGKISKNYIKHIYGFSDIGKFYLSPKNQLMVVPYNCGYMHTLSAKTKELLYSLKMNSDARGVNFNKDGTLMYSHSDDGEVYIWDVRQRKCLLKFIDDGCIHGTSIALSSSEQYLATGSDMGVVNIYETSSLLATSSPKPVKSFLNLTTAITSLKFNSTSEILTMASSDKNAAIRMVHCSSMTVFSNFPNSTWDWGPVTTLDMSVNSGYLTAATVNGDAHLIRLRHYSSY